ncbi:MAG: helix-turn-helix domain-containing protein [Saccharofermentanales bacterium]|jgi:phage antirepressor YoqD-like protein
MPRKKTEEVSGTPILKTVEQMSKISGLGENTLRDLLDRGEIDYVQNGNRKLMTEQAILDWYERSKVSAKPKCD